MEQESKQEDVVEVKEEVKTEIQEDKQTFDQNRFKEELFKEWNTRLEQERAEAEKTKNMKEDEKAKYEIDKKLKESAEREKELIKRELRLDAHGLLVEKGLNPKLLDILNYSSKEDCTKSIDTLESVFRECVALAVDEKLKGSTPTQASGSSTNSVEDEIKKALNII